MIADICCSERSLRSGIFCCLNCSKRDLAVGSPDWITVCDERTNLSSQLRCRRSVTPLRSGPTLMPLPNVWQAEQIFLNVFAGSVKSAANAGTTEREIGRAHV